MDGGLGDHVHHDRAYVREVHTPGRPVSVGLLRRRVEGRLGKDRVGSANLVPVMLEDIGRRLGRSDLPITASSLGEVVRRLTRDDAAEPIVLIRPMSGPPDRPGPNP